MTTEVKPDWYVCSTSSYFEDDVQAKCSKCKKNVFHRPYGPKDIKKICTNCLLKMEGVKKK